MYDNVAYALQVTGGTRREIRDKVPDILRLTGLSTKLHNYPDQLSGGEQQRVSIARAFVNHPPLLLADEPTGNLDPETSVDIMRLLYRINRTGTTVLVATHDQAMVDKMRRRVLELSEGRIVRDEATGLYTRDETTREFARRLRAARRRARPGSCSAMKLGFFLREAMRSMRRSAAPSFAALATVLVTMLVLGVFIPIVQATNGAANSVRGRVEVDVYMKTNATAADDQRVQHELLGLPHVKSVQFVSKQQAYTAAGRADPAGLRSCSGPTRCPTRSTSFPTTRATFWPSTARSTGSGSGGERR